MALACNVGGADKSIRIVIGIALIAFAFLANVDVIWKEVAGGAAAIALITNSLLGINSCKQKS